MSRQNSEANLVTFVNPNSPISEAYRTLRTNIQFSSIDHPVQVIMCASAQSGEGKTTTISNLAVTYAHEGKNVLLIDADLRKPTLHNVFVTSNRVGLSNLIAGQCALPEVTVETRINHLSVIPSGPVPPNPSELLGSQRMRAIMKDIRSRYDIILLDTPPVLAVPDSLIVSSLSDGVIMVVQAGKVKSDMVRKAKAGLEHAKARILGVVLNRIKRNENAQFIRYYGSK
ncbi:capsular biosynthesis protein [Paenibacillus sp. 32O-W]|uniref:CpsD/CapB family tyrosine-protein kinase n=1 Tax=Paenibacillus sp. 32O-W TaxID=1695218 RepID=UPI00071F50C6|nr:CpsD/CapB family tyrosine-protein kinase [Paenibacillus sp. 32O-W]ALS29720.1 capsular biosynthesis protein [Paenibacillus sp. 32O-W]